MAATGSKILAPIAASLALLFVSAQSAAFEISGSKWKGGTTDFYVSLIGKSPSGIPWHDSFLAAIADWDDNTVFDFTLIEQSIDPCLEDGLNSVDFTNEVCGSEYGANTLAVTLRRLSTTLLGEPNIFEADIVINSDVRYDIYDGALYPGSNRRIDFRHPSAISIDPPKTTSPASKPSTPRLRAVRRMRSCSAPGPTASPKATAPSLRLPPAGQTSATSTFTASI